MPCLWLCFAWVLFQHNYRGGWVEESITNKVREFASVLEE
jgi:hypothetical protein